MKTYIPTEEETRLTWKLVDAEGCVLGRLASRVARILRGKDSPLFVPFLAMGSAVIIINAEKIRLTGKKIRAEVLPPPYRLSGRCKGDSCGSFDGRTAGARCARGHFGNAAEEPIG